MGDRSLLNAIAMSPDMSAAASSSVNSHRFSAPRTPSLSKGLNSPPVYSMSGQQQSDHQSPFYSQMQGAQAAVNPFTTSSDSVPAMPSSPQLRPHRPASTPSNNNSNNNNLQNSSNLQNVPNSNQNPLFHSKTNPTLESSRSTLQQLQSSTSPNGQQMNQNAGSGQQFISSQNQQDFTYKLSKTFSFSTAHDSSPLQVSPISRSTTPLAAQDLNLLHHSTSLHSVPSGHSIVSSQANLGGVQETGVHFGFARTAESNAGSMSSVPSPDQSNINQPSPRTDGSRIGTRSTSSTANECPSPQVSDLGSEDTNASVSQESFAQSYISLTPWTTKLTSPGYIPLPHPSPEAMPIPLENINKEYMLAISPSSFDIPPQSRSPRSHQAYSRLQPGMGYNNAPYGKSVKNGVIGGNQHTQKAHFKILPNKEHRFKRTVDALQKSGLWDVAMKTGNLIKRNQELQKELEQFRSDALTFLKSVIKNPQNRDFIKNVLNNALASNSTPRNGSSVMTVVVSAAAAAAAASVRLDSSGSTDGSSSMSGSTST